MDGGQRGVPEGEAQHLVKRELHAQRKLAARVGEGMEGSEVCQKDSLVNLSKTARSAAPLRAVQGFAGARNAVG